MESQHNSRHEFYNLKSVIQETHDPMYLSKPSSVTIQGTFLVLGITKSNFYIYIILLLFF